MRGQNERIRIAIGAPLQIAFDHAWPVNTVCDAQLFGVRFQTRHQPHLVRPGNHHIHVVRQVAHALCKCIDQQVASLLGMNAADKEKKSLVLQFRKRTAKCLTLFLRITGVIRSAVTHHTFAVVESSENVPRAEPLFFAGEQDPLRIAQHTPLGQPPINLLEDMPDRILLAEPRIHHAVSKDEVRHWQPTHPQPRAIRGEVPQPMEDNNIEAVCIAAHPQRQSQIETITPQTFAERRQRKRERASERLLGSVEADDFHCVPLAHQSLRAPRQGLNRPAGFWLRTVNDSKDSHMR